MSDRDGSDPRCRGGGVFETQTEVAADVVLDLHALALTVGDGERAAIEGVGVFAVGAAPGVGRVAFDAGAAGEGAAVPAQFAVTVVVHHDVAVADDVGVAADAAFHAVAPGAADQDVVAAMRAQGVVAAFADQQVVAVDLARIAAGGHAAGVEGAVVVRVGITDRIVALIDAQALRIGKAAAGIEIDRGRREVLIAQAVGQSGCCSRRSASSRWRAGSSASLIVGTRPYSATRSG